MRQRVLVVCLVNSVHSAKWLAQFQDSEIDFYIFPSDYFMDLHPLLAELISGSRKATYSIPKTARSRSFDYMQERILNSVLPFFSRKNRLHRYVKRINPNIVHALGFQQAAYLCVEIIRAYGKKYQFLATNWGSDIYHFRNFSEHLVLIQEVLKLADKYSAECQRDYDLAIELGFKGTLLPVIPNAGGIPITEITAERPPASSRSLILIKGYGGVFGRVQLVIKLLYPILTKFDTFSVFIYSVTKDVESLVKDLKFKFPDNVDYSTLDKPLTYSQLQAKFSISRVYVGCSVSDGISTSFLESIASGTYAIQSNTSCAQEWIRKGAIASLVNLDKHEIQAALELALNDDDLVDLAQKHNLEIAKVYLEYEKIKKISQSFYL
jgi:glycosyltransferase involved in cell wall biosynthesis